MNDLENVVKESEEIEKYEVNSNNEDSFETYKTYKKNDKDSKFNQRDDDFYTDYPKYFFAGGFIRLVAFIIDSILISAMRTAILNMYMHISHATIPIGKGSPYAIVTTVLTLVYFAVLTYLNKGQTLGKMIMGIRVVNNDGKRPEFIQTIIREVFMRYIHTVFPILYAVIIFHPKKQSLSDIICDSYVVSEKVETAFDYGKKFTNSYNI